MFGKEVYELTHTCEEIFDLSHLEIIENQIILNTKSGKQVIIKGKSFPHVTQILTEVVTELQSFVIENGKIVLPSNIFWRIYKKNAIAKEMLHTLSFEIEGTKYKIVDRDYYFPQNMQVVYGIYYNNDLIYIGSSGNYIDRWKQHDTNFRNKVEQEMYIAEFDADKIEYKVLIEGSKVFEDLGAKPDQWILENVEKFMIEQLQPRYNKEGKNQDFVFRATKLNAKVTEEDVRNWCVKNIE